MTTKKELHAAALADLRAHSWKPVVCGGCGRVKEVRCTDEGCARTVPMEDNQEARRTLALSAPAEVEWALEIADSLAAEATVADPLTADESAAVGLAAEVRRLRAIIAS